ncbi:MAG: phosphoadenylylsulfate reductase [Gammaproteobacteria bacterium]|uniref:Phosphoadenylylsulfate reductase n=1 Tax=OM182 bacterium TaxID=2510334 RepID=A0A520RX58_9GAMM|nr:phosphoadenylylsulfate reductase [Gammaproteobacteria bacterium]RZO74832.1 MAG: phosphoadenylylsulfate reductase [OM182 bacterium]
MEFDLSTINEQFRDEPPDRIIAWAISNSKHPIVSTNFGPHEAAILYACVKQKPDIKVIWCDSGYNTEETYRHADTLIAELKLEISIYLPRKSAAHRQAVMGGVPDIDDPLHADFTEEVKLEPFSRAMRDHQPDVWLNNVRKGQTTFRDSLDIASKSSDGILKISPFFFWSDHEIQAYLNANDLPNETSYFDPTKVLEHRECGLHTR